MENIQWKKYIDKNNNIHYHDSDFRQFIFELVDWRHVL